MFPHLFQHGCVNSLSLACWVSFVLSQRSRDRGWRNLKVKTIASKWWKWESSAGCLAPKPSLLPPLSCYYVWNMTRPIKEKPHAFKKKRKFSLNRKNINICLFTQLKWKMTLTGWAKMPALCVTVDERYSVSSPRIELSARQAAAGTKDGRKV